jgi:hypothetical protein
MYVVLMIVYDAGGCEFVPHMITVENVTNSEEAQEKARAIVAREHGRDLDDEDIEWAGTLDLTQEE